MQRRPSQELLDSDFGTPKEVCDSLLDLRWFNRWFGGVATVRGMIQSIVQRIDTTTISVIEVARRAVLVHDLIRNPFQLALAYAGLPFYRSRITRNDAPASVRQAYTVKEMESFFREAAATKIETQQHYFYRMGVIAWKEQSA